MLKILPRLMPLLCLLLLVRTLAPCILGAATISETELRRMAGQMVMIGFRGLALTESDQITRDVAEGRVGGVVLFATDVALNSPVRNVQSPEQVRSLTEYLKQRATAPLLVLVDQEGGRVARFSPKHGFPATLPAQELGERDSLEFTRQQAKAMGLTLSQAGVSMNLAPVVDVNVNPDNPAIGKLGRSFSADPETVALHAQAFIQGLTEAGIMNCVKHFPGHGSTWNDSHHGMADVSDTWRESELLPYQRLFAAGVVDAVMTAHVFNARLDPDYPATLSRAVINGLLRQRLGYQGVVFSDDMQMKAVTSFYGLEQAVTLSVNAGVDVLLFGNNLNYDPLVAVKVVDMLVAKVRSGEIPLARIQESHDRIMRLKARMR